MRLQATPLERLQEGDEVVYVLLGEVQVEASVIEVDSIQQRCRRTIMKIGRTTGKSTQDGSFNLANVIELAIDQSLSEIGGCFAVVGRQA